MPTNVRTPSTGSIQNPGVCSPTTLDQIGAQDNLLTRVEKIEAVLSTLLGMDISALQLSDITEVAGVLTDLIAISSNAEGGWIDDGTFTGVAISTLGWLMSDGSTFPVVVMQDGHLVYGWTGSGAIAVGENPDGTPNFGSSAVPEAGIVIRCSGSGADEIWKKGTVNVTHPPTVGATPYVYGVTMPYSGLYMVTAYALFLTSTLGARTIGIEWDRPDPLNIVSVSDTPWYIVGGPGTQSHAGNTSMMFYSPTSPVTLRFAAGSSSELTNWQFSIAKF